MIVAGFGFRGIATTDSLADALEQACDGHMPTALATLPQKAGHGVIQSLAARLNVPVFGVVPLADQVTLTQSAAALAAHGTGSVAEATALAVAGSGARLLAPRTISTDRLATCAIAMGEPS